MALVEYRVGAEERFAKLLKFRSKTDASSDTDRLQKTFVLAQELYGDMMHWTGETILEHVVGVLEGYMQFKPDDDGVIACMLHHALDRKLWTLDDLERRYGASVRSIVSGVHLLSHVTMKNRRMSIENLRLMFLRVSDDIRVVLLILCDNNHKLERLHAMPPEKRRYVCRDVLHLFAPVAARLGIYSLKHQLETSAFPVAYPTDAARIAEQIHSLKKRHGDFLDAAAEQLSSFLLSQGVSAEVEGREKQSFSIFQKMRTKSITHVEDIYDLFALRVIVDTEATCYQTLGLLHRIGHPVQHRFKDYIAFPKPNGYQSLHTTLARFPGVPEGVFVEVQIRTEEMHKEADLGIAAHWSYKEGGTAQIAAHRAQLQRALTLQQPIEDSGHVSGLSDHIFVLTPTGDIIELPEGATPLDFAFHVHTALGLSFRAARVNGVIVPITHELENGDIVEILRFGEPKPSQNWMSLLKTASARSRLKHYLQQHERPMYVQLGREALNQELARHKLPSLDPDLTIVRSFAGKRLSFADREDVLMKVGQGSQTASSILPHLDAIKEELVSRRDDVKKHQHVIDPELHRVRVEGNIPMPVRFARCCKADGGKHVEIAGVVGRDGVVRIHKDTCKMLRNVNPERRISVRWGKATAKH